MKQESVALITDLATLPVLMTAKEVGNLARMDTRAMRRALQRGTFVKPCYAGPPVLFSRDQVLAHLGLTDIPLEPPKVAPEKPRVSVDKIKARQEASRRNKGR